MTGVRAHGQRWTVAAQLGVAADDCPPFASLGLAFAAERRYVGQIDAMGCDIHLFAEYGAGGTTFEALSDGAFPVRADYDLFAALAGVRAKQGFVPFQAPRGIPNDVSPEVATRYFLPVLEDDRAGAWHVGEHLRPGDLEELVRSGTAQWRPEATTAPLTQGTHGHVAHPDWHNAGWLSAHEVHLALAHAGYQLLAADEAFQLFVGYIDSVALRKGSSTRIVFWFDN